VVERQNGKDEKQERLAEPRQLREIAAGKLLGQWKSANRELLAALESVNRPKKRKKISDSIRRARHNIKRLAPILSLDPRVAEINVGLPAPSTFGLPVTSQKPLHWFYKIEKVHTVLDRLLEYLESFPESIELYADKREPMLRQLVRELGEISRRTTGKTDSRWVGETIKTGLGLDHDQSDKGPGQEKWARDTASKKPKGLFKSNWKAPDLYSRFFCEIESEPREYDDAALEDEVKNLRVLFSEPTKPSKKTRSAERGTQSKSANRRQ
jgi:hypothetical protein